MKRLVAISALSVAVLAVGPAARAQQGGSVEDKVARLEGEVAELKRLLKTMLDLDRQRSRILEDYLLNNPSSGGLSSAPSSGGSAPAAAAGDEGGDRSVEKKSDAYGTVSGKVILPAGETVGYVYVESVQGRSVKGKRVEIKQLDGQFTPRWAVIQKGTEIHFPNEDATYHNVFAKDPEATFDLGIYRKGDEPKGFVFTKAGDIDVYCNMHAKMSARVLVVPNHLFIRVKPDGSFTLPGIPPGNHKIVAWAPSAAPATQNLSVRAGGTADVSFQLESRAKAQHLKKDGKPYGSYN